VIVSHELLDDVVDEAVARGEVEYSPVLQPGQTAAQRSDPERPVGIAEQCLNAAGEQAVARVQGADDFTALPAV
jgi:hypothetical protein